MIELNIVALSGRIVGTPEVKTYPSGSRVVRYVMTVRVEEPRRRVDVIPVYYWLHDSDEEPYLPYNGDGMAVVGQLQRRFFVSGPDRKDRLEVIAERVGPANGDREATLKLILGGLEEE